jgi:hypothetical protein
VELGEGEKDQLKVPLFIVGRGPKNDFGMLFFHLVYDFGIVMKIFSQIK